MRLLVYTDAAEYGGAERALAILVESLRDDIDVTVAGIERRIVEAVTYARPRATAAVVPAAASLTAHHRLIRRAHADVIQVNLRTPYSCTAALTAATLTPGLRTVAVEHLPLASSSRSRRWLKRQLSRRLAAHVSVSERAARTIESEAGLPSGSIRTIHNGVPLRGAVTTRAPNAPATVAVIGRLDRQKGIDVLFDAVAEMPHVSVLVVGDGPERHSLTAHAERLGLATRVAFVGWEDDVHARLGQIDALVLPSRNEALPLVVLEAMLAGVPVLASDVGGLRECIEHDRTGLLVPPDDAAALAVELRRLVDDPALRTRLAAAAATRALARHTASAMAASYERLYAEIGAE